MSTTVGVDLGGTKMLVGVVGPGETVHYRATETRYGDTAEAIMARLETEVRLALAAHPGSDAVGLGVPCTIDRARGLAISAVNLPLVDVPLRDLMSERLQLPVFLDNDANLAALAEHRFGAARGARDVVMLTIGTGIGGGLVINGELYRGSSGAGAEMGHVVVEADGPPCQGNCPNHGCVETMASGTALARDGRAAAEREPDSALGRILADGDLLDGRAVVAAAQAGDEVAGRVVSDAGRYVGVALSSLLYGVPLNKSGDFTGNVLDLFNGYTVTAGIAVALLFSLHGATFLALRTDGALRERAAAAARPLCVPVALVVAAFLAWTVAVAVDRNGRDLFPPILPAAVGAAALAIGVACVLGRRSGWAFVMSAVASLSIVATLFTSLYPRVLVSDPGLQNSLTVSGAAAAHYALSVITVVAAVLLPVMLLYQGWTYHVFRARLGRTPGGSPTS